MLGTRQRPKGKGADSIMGMAYQPAVVLLFLVTSHGLAQGTISGKALRTGSNPRPLAGFEVYLQQGKQKVATIRAAKDGSYTFKNVPEGKYFVEIAGAFG